MAVTKKSAVKKAAFGTTVPKPKAKAPVQKKKMQTPADFYPESYDKKFPRTPGGGDNYDQTIKYENEAKKKGLMKMGGSLKPVPAGKKGLAKLPTKVRNKMGFQKNGGKTSKKK